MHLYAKEFMFFRVLAALAVSVSISVGAGMGRDGEYRVARCSAKRIYAYSAKAGVKNNISLAVF